jgi:hypothetical protein
VAGRSNTVTVNEDTSLDRVKAAQVSKLMALAPPYPLWLIFGGVGLAFHALFGADKHAPYRAGAAFSAMGMTLLSVLVTGVTFLVSHHRGMLGRGSSSATAAAVCLWITVCSVAGFTPAIFWLWLVGGLATCACWNIRTVIRTKAGISGVVDPLAMLFDHSKDKAGLGGAAMKTVETGERKIEAKMALPGGQKTVEDIQKKTEYVEGAMGLPPGTMTVTADLDNAAMANVVVSDPRVMRRPIPWPGPSLADASIAVPIRPGVWQDLDDVEYTITGHHVQVMGMTGSGKSIGCTWNALAEIVTRIDVMVLAIDLVKGLQTLGPLAESLHRLEITEDGARSLIRELKNKLAERTNYLASKGLVKWKEGCGLTYIVLWIEEAWRLFEILSDDEMDQFEELMKALRSAGGSVFYSLQRGDHTQMPTIIKGQVAFWCFGLASSHDAKWGLSEAQQNADASPEQWGSDQPGMAYLHAPGMDRARIAMPMRTFDWAEDTAAMRAHCARYPAASKPVDAISASLVRLPGGAEPAVTPAAPAPDMPVQDEDAELLQLAAELVVTSQRASRQMLIRKLRIGVEQADRLMRELARHEVIGSDFGDEGACEVLAAPDSLGEVLEALKAQDPQDSHRTPDPDPSVRAGLHDDIADDPDDQEFSFGQPEGKKMLPAQARQVLLEQIEQWRGEERERFATRDMKAVLERTGLSRAWVQARLKELVKEGALAYDDAEQEFVIRTPVGARS